jgi:hypothetical protein
MGHLLYHHTVLKILSGAAFFGMGMLFDILFLADWSKLWNTDRSKLIKKWQEKVMDM